MSDRFSYVNTSLANVLSRPRSFERNIGMDNWLARVRRKLENRSLLLAKRTVHGVNRRFGPKSGKQVVFVGGIHRSGTNMIMDVLERSFETDVYHESDPRAFEDYQMRPGPVIHRLVDESNTRHLVIKALCELHEIGELLADFAPAKALWVVRNFDDMVNSHLRKWSGCPVTIGNIVADRNNAGWRGGGMSDFDACPGEEPVHASNQ